MKQVFSLRLDSEIIESVKKSAEVRNIPLTQLVTERFTDTDSSYLKSRIKQQEDQIEQLTKSLHRYQPVSRPKRISVSVTQEQFERYTQLCKASGKSKSEFMRSLLDGNNQAVLPLAIK